MGPEQAAVAGELLGARVVVPMHFGGFDFDPHYIPVEDCLRRFRAAAEGRPYEVRVLEPDETLDLASV